MKKYVKYTSLVLLGALVLALVFLFLNFDVSIFLENSMESPLLAALVILGLYCVKSVVMVIPLAALYLGAGVLFPVGWALAITCAGLYCEMTISYFIGRSMKIDKVKALMSQNKFAAKLLNRHSTMTASACFFFRLLPIPFDPVSMLCGTTSLQYPKYVAFSFLGVAPKMIPWVIIGRSISTLFSTELIIAFIIIAAVIACVYTLFMRPSKDNDVATDDV